ncbi:hypothetical protein E2C01_000496 [Portunus trituberculatus]|uniref:Uncharacterized protein n=1 Tax=Portunus trituberculatus TaxID=210409 RepID=A0A5B7CFE7_PORTR|nr:hypothetical protein [Portunus trituberculatus]
MGSSVVILFSETANLSPAAKLVPAAPQLNTPLLAHAHIHTSMFSTMPSHSSLWRHQSAMLIQQPRCPDTLDTEHLQVSPTCPPGTGRVTPKPLLTRRPAVCLSVSAVARPRRHLSNGSFQPVQSSGVGVAVHVQSGVGVVVHLEIVGVVVHVES